MQTRTLRTRQCIQTSATSETPLVGRARVYASPSAFLTVWAFIPLSSGNGEPVARQGRTRAGRSVSDCSPRQPKRGWRLPPTLRSGRKDGDDLGRARSGGAYRGAYGEAGAVGPEPSAPSAPRSRSAHKAAWRGVAWQQSPRGRWAPGAAAGRPRPVVGGSGARRGAGGGGLQRCGERRRGGWGRYVGGWQAPLGNLPLLSQRGATIT